MLRRLVAFACVLAVLLGAASGSVADDVPDEVRKLYDKARDYEAKGDLKKAYSALSKAKSKNPLSIDFWELYVRVWRALDKKEDVLWNKIIGKLEKKHPESVVFDLLRARLTDDDEARMQHYRDAIAKNPDAIAPQLLLAKAVLASGDDIEADEILEQLLEKHPGNEEALVVRGELDLDADRALSALAFAEEQLEEHDLPGLHDLRARALMAGAASDASKLEEAEQAARKAMAGREDPRYVRTLVDILDMKGDVDAAVQVLDEHYAKSKAAILAAKLGELAFRKGDYEKAIPGLAADPDPDTAVLKGLATCHARLGNLEAMRRVFPRLQKRLAEDEPLWIAWVELLAGQPDAALAAAEGMEDEEADYLRLWAAAVKGDVAAARRYGDEDAATGSRGGEEALLAIVGARMMAKLGGKAKATHKMMREAEVAASKSGVPAAAVDTSEPALQVGSSGYMARSVTYRKSLGGHWFSPVTDNITISPGKSPDGKDELRLGIMAVAECPIESQRAFWFNPIEMSGDTLTPQDIQRLLQQLLSEENNEKWEAAQAAFVEGSEAMVAEDWAKAKTAFAKAAEIEPAWGRALLFAAAADLLGGGDAGAAAKAGFEALKLLPDDFDGYRLVVLMQRLAGEDGKALAKEIGRKEAAYAIRRIEAL